MGEPYDEYVEYIVTLGDKVLRWKVGLREHKPEHFARDAEQAAEWEFGREKIEEIGEEIAEMIKSGNRDKIKLEVVVRGITLEGCHLCIDETWDKEDMLNFALIDLGCDLDLHLDNAWKAERKRRSDGKT